MHERPAISLGLLLLVATSLACGDRSRPACVPVSPGDDVGTWSAYGGDDGGARYSPLADITPENVHCLERAWIHHSGDLPGERDLPATLAAEVTPILVDETLYLCTPYNRVLALDPETGAERWSHDPEIDLTARYANQLVCRGVAAWLDPLRAAGERCRRRILTATNDARLIALDGADGTPCPDFGAAGEVDLTPGVGEPQWRGEYQVTSPPAVVGDVVVVGSAISDNARSDAPSGVVRGYDVRTGALRWAWDLRPGDFQPTQDNTTEAGYARATPNVWAPMSVDAERGLVFVPTGNPAPDYYRADGRTLDDFGSSVVALRAGTGEIAWHFQTVHRDLWDFDVPAQPTLFTLRRDGREIPAVVQATKMGFLFVLHRETGEPLFPVEERPVPQRAAPGQPVSPTQPFPLKPPGLVRQVLSPEDAWGITPWDRGVCRDAIASLRFDGMYTPPSLEGTLMVPGNAGGSNWGGVAVDAERQHLFANTQDLPWSVTLVPREQEIEREDGDELAPMEGTPYRMLRKPLLSPLGVPCSEPPWGTLASVDLATGALRWQRPVGTLRAIAGLPIELGMPNLGGPLVSAAGLVFLAATFDDTFRAFDAASGEELWQDILPFGGQATPMTYRVRPGGRQFVVIAATGYGRIGMPEGDALIAYALPAP